MANLAIESVVMFPKSVSGTSKPWMAADGVIECGSAIGRLAQKRKKINNFSCIYLSEPHSVVIQP